MSIKNYFKVPQRKRTAECFFFDGADVLSTQSAFSAAVLASGGRSDTVTVWARPTVYGPWDRCKLIGENPRDAGDKAGEAAE